MVKQLELQFNDRVSANTHHNVLVSATVTSAVETYLYRRIETNALIAQA